jgi:hypothetical protein
VGEPGVAPPAAAGPVAGVAPGEDGAADAGPDRPAVVGVERPADPAVLPDADEAAPSVDPDPASVCAGVAAPVSDDAAGPASALSLPPETRRALRAATARSTSGVAPQAALTSETDTTAPATRMRVQRRQTEVLMAHDPFGSARLAGLRQCRPGPDRAICPVVRTDPPRLRRGDNDSARASP